ncbi:hypothetical protein [Paenibacillus alvei]|uniref:hypothetical protein n=1 Tax=Paenibacillus alvei TaxID=44250 RepID=UPI001F513C46|nr:hypothetical protein [Paenibacillus alvei]
MNKSEIITGQIVVEGGKVSLQREDGSLVELSKSDRIEIFKDGKFEPAPYSRVVEKVDSAGWPLYAGLYASVERFRGEPPTLRQIAHRLFSLVEKGRTPEELATIGMDFANFAANIYGGWKDTSGLEKAAPEEELHKMNNFLAARQLYYKVEEGRTWEELLEIGRLITKYAESATPSLTEHRT